MRLPRHKTRKARIEIIPMIDTIFFLLVFFMFSSLSMVKLRGMNVALPKPAPAGADGQPSPNHLVVLTVTDGGRYFIGKQPVDPNQLHAALASHLAGDPRMTIVLNLSASQTTQSLIRIMDGMNGLKTPAGQPVRALIATVPVDSGGHAMMAAPQPHGGPHAR